MNFHKLLIIIISTAIIGGTLIANYYEELREENLQKMAIEKESYETLDNPYFLDKKIKNYDDLGNLGLPFLNNKSNYYMAQKKLDENKYEDALSYLNKINSGSFDTLKYDLKGDVYNLMGNNDEAKNNYNKALKSVSKENEYLKNAIHSKYESLFQ